ncbi:MAG: hypothetical protein ACRD6U_04435 [Nitrososphaeraceae archaeon]
MIPRVHVGIGFLLVGIFIKVMDKIIPHLHPKLPPESVEDPKQNAKKITYLFLL